MVIFIFYHKKEAKFFELRLQSLWLKAVAQAVLFDLIPGPPAVKPAELYLLYFFL
jgi:hypothetical protein